MKKVTLILLSLAITLTAGWWRTYGEGSGNCVRQTNDGGFILTGGNWLLLKLDERSDIEWKVDRDTFGCGLCIQQLTSGDYVILTSINNPITGKLVKIDRHGHFEWSSYIGFDVSWFDKSIDVGFIVTGEDSHWLSGDPEDWCTTLELLKLDSEGNLEWQKSFGPKITWSFSRGLSVKQTSDSCFIIAGYYGGESWLWLIKTNALGNIIWEQHYGNMYPGMTVDQTTDGGYIVACDYCWLLRTDSLGDEIWRKSFDGYSGWWGGPSVQQLPDGGFIMVARTPATDSTNGGDLLLIKIDSLGNTIWERTYGKEGWDGGKAVQVASDGGFVATGWLSSTDNESHYIYPLKTDSLGLLAVEEPEPTPETQPGFEVVTAVGKQIVLRFSPSESRSQGENVAVFDAAGRQVDEIRVPAQGGTITWPVTPGECFSPGVYFIREMGKSATTHKGILIH